MNLEVLISGTVSTGSVPAKFRVAIIGVKEGASMLKGSVVLTQLARMDPAQGRWFIKQLPQPFAASDCECFREIIMDKAEALIIDSVLGEHFDLSWSVAGEMVLPFGNFTPWVADSKPSMDVGPGPGPSAIRPFACLHCNCYWPTEDDASDCCSDS